LAEQRQFELVTYTKSACQFAVFDQLVGDPPVPYENCNEWRDNVTEILTSPSGPDLVITSGSVRADPVKPDGSIPDVGESDRLFVSGLEAAWQPLAAAGVPVAVIVDTPFAGFDVPECVAENRTELSACAFDRAVAMVGHTKQQRASRDIPVQLIDMTDRICGPNLCPAVFDDYLVWRDAHHLTATYAGALADVLAERIDW